MTNDPVNHPAHYTNGGIECIDAIQAALTPEEFRGYLKGNAIKYVWRERMKGGNESIDKARWYVQRLLNGEGRNVPQHPVGNTRTPSPKTPPWGGVDLLGEPFAYDDTLGIHTSIGSYGGSD